MSFANPDDDQMAAAVFMFGFRQLGDFIAAFAATVPSSSVQCRLNVDFLYDLISLGCVMTAALMFQFYLGMIFGNSRGNLNEHSWHEIWYSMMRKPLEKYLNPSLESFVYCSRVDIVTL